MRSDSWLGKAPVAALWGMTAMRQLGEQETGPEAAAQARGEGGCKPSGEAGRSLVIRGHSSKTSPQSDLLLQPRNTAITC